MMSRKDIIASEGERGVIKLQWSRDDDVAERRIEDQPSLESRQASMEPRR